ncbi:MAG: GGDEF domain-containing protein [Myxococcota bacterium]|jgi:GGDEF domain-containing protein
MSTDNSSPIEPTERCELSDTILVVEPSTDESVDWTDLAPTAVVVDSPSEALDFIADAPPAVVVAGAYALMPDGRSLLAHVAEGWPDVVRVVAAPRGHAPSAIHVINEAGVFGYIELPPGPAGAAELLGRALDHGLRVRRQAATIGELRGALMRMEQQIAMVESQSIAEQAQIDSITGLWGRAHVVERIEDEANRLARYDIPFGAVMIEVPAAAEVAAAELVADFIRKVDVAGRVEPGRIVVVCPNTSDGGMRRVLARLTESFESEDLPGCPSGILSGIAIATCTLDAPKAPPDEVLFRLQTALNTARTTGGTAHYESPPPLVDQPPDAE